METSLTNVHIVGEDFLRAFWKLYYVRFCISSVQWRNTVQQRLFERQFSMKIIITMTWLYNHSYNFYCVEKVQIRIYFLSEPKKALYFDSVFLHSVLFSSWILFFCHPFLETKDRTKFWASWLKRNITVFCLQRVTHYFKTMLSSVEHWKVMSLLFIPVHIMVPWYFKSNVQKN